MRKPAVFMLAIVLLAAVGFGVATKKSGFIELRGYSSYGSYHK